MCPSPTPCAIGYASASDYFRDLIRRDQDAENSSLLSVEDIRRSIEQGRLEAETFSADEVYSEIKRKIAKVGELA
jgi:Arc/MetJ-type ribon-helix-helix transcriptional regulator